MVGELVADGRRRLGEASFQPSAREAYLLLGHVLELSEAQVIARWDHEVEPGAALAFRALLERRLDGEPVAYLLGRREFYGRPFLVDSRVLIPRPESEHIVEAALALPLAERARILDLGTGSGCLAVTLALERPESRVVAIDLSLAALALAGENARALGAPNASMVGSDLATSVGLESFDLVVCNPPYVGHEEAVELSVEVRDFEPHLALFAPGDAESVVRRLIRELAGLRSGAFLVFEIGHLQSERAVELLAPSAFSLERIVSDYQGIERVFVARRK